MCVCEICKTKFKNNLGGDLTKHLSSVHNISLEEYVIKTTFNGIAPVCKCGYCNNRPSFVRGKFLSFTKGHNTKAWIQKSYIKKNGPPKCMVCGKLSGFKRKTPKKFCSNKCSGSLLGFSDPNTQITIRKNIKEKYGVENASQIPSVRKKLSELKIGTTFVMSESGRKNISNSLIKRWKNLEYKKRVSRSIKKSLNTPAQRARRKEIQLEKLMDENYRNAVINNLCKVSKKFSRLHRKIRKELELEKYGFVSERRVGKYLVDELNEDRKIIIEINGDYVHANPTIYKSDDIIRLPGNSYTASEKWDSDSIKRNFLESLGYKVITIWESDDIDSVRFILK